MKLKGIIERVNSRLLKGILVLLSTLVLSACNKADDGNRVDVADGVASMAFTAPQLLLQPRNIVRENLILRCLACHACA